MDKQEWINGYARHLVTQGRGAATANLLAKATAEAHERIKGGDVSLWPSVDTETIFNTDGEEAI